MKSIFFLLFFLFVNFDVLAVGQDISKENSKRTFVEKKIEKEDRIKAKLIKFIKKERRWNWLLVLGILGILLGVGMIIYGFSGIISSVLSLLLILLGGFLAIIFPLILFSIFLEKIQFS